MTAWEYYNESMEIIDRQRARDWIEQMDTILIFVGTSYLLYPFSLISQGQAGLFAAFLSTFLIELLSRLEPDPMDIIQDVLVYQTQMMRNPSLGPYVPADFSPPEYIVIVNALFYTSLGIMLVSAFIAMLIKSWVREFDRGLRAISGPEQQAKTREFRYLGLVRWKLPEMVATLPILIQISLLSFAVGLVIFLFHISRPSCGITAGILGIGAIFYAITTSISIFITSSPFRSPLSHAFGSLYRRVHAYFCQEEDEFLREVVFNFPTTTIARWRQTIYVYLRKYRPYPEETFMRPFEEAKMDEVQRIIAASVLERIHNSASDSPQSESLYWSVWHISGSTTVRIPPSLIMPEWIHLRLDDPDYVARLPPACISALLAVNMRAKFPLSLESSRLLSHFSGVRESWSKLIRALLSRDVTNMIKLTELNNDEFIWILDTLSEWSIAFDDIADHIETGLAMVLARSPQWFTSSYEDGVILEAVVTFAALLFSSDQSYQRKTLANSRQQPWLLPNLRNPELIRKLLEDADPRYHEQLISLLFLVYYYLKSSGACILAAHYFTIITSRGGSPLPFSPLVTVAPAMPSYDVFQIMGLLVTPQVGIANGIYQEFDLHGIIGAYDSQLAVGHTPDPNFLATLLLISENLSPRQLGNLQDPNYNPLYRNPWLALTGMVLAELDIPDALSAVMESFYDHKVCNMIAAQSLLRYSQGTVTHYTESVLLASFLQSREVIISSLALWNYMRTILSYNGPPAEPPRYLPDAVQLTFNPDMPYDQLWMGWNVLRMFVEGRNNLTLEWQQTFAAAFFTVLEQQLPRLHGDPKGSTPTKGLRRILTWEYFHESEHEPEYLEREANGLDWMIAAWEVHLSSRSGRGERGPVQMDGEPHVFTIDEEFVLQALCALCDGAADTHIAPVLSQLCEFVQSFDNPSLNGYRTAIILRVKAIENLQKHGHFSRAFPV